MLLHHICYYLTKQVPKLPLKIVIHKSIIWWRILQFYCYNNIKEKYFTNQKKMANIKKLFFQDVLLILWEYSTFT